jgi:hypothetical protein
MQKLLIRGLLIFPLAAVFAVILSDFGILLGALLALGSFYMSQASLHFVLKVPVLPGPVAAVTSFFFRLGLLGLVFFLLATLTELNTVAVLSSFILLYTLLLFLEMKLAAFPPSHNRF